MEGRPTTGGSTKGELRGECKGGGGTQVLTFWDAKSGALYIAEPPDGIQLADLLSRAISEALGSPLMLPLSSFIAVPPGGLPAVCQDLGLDAASSPGEVILLFLVLFLRMVLLAREKDIRLSRESQSHNPFPFLCLVQTSCARALVKGIPTCTYVYLRTVYLRSFPDSSR